ncbi:MAG: hypothetical protein AAGI30_02265 [Planctomycetota bacterium]
MDIHRACLFGGALFAAGIPGTDGSAQAVTNLGTSAYAESYNYSTYAYDYLLVPNSTVSSYGGVASVGDGGFAGVAWDADAGTWGASARQGADFINSNVSFAITSRFTVPRFAIMSVDWQFAGLVDLNVADSFWQVRIFDGTIPPSPSSSLTGPLVDAYGVVQFFSGAPSQLLDPDGSARICLSPSNSYWFQSRMFALGSPFGRSDASVDARIELSSLGSLDLDDDDDVDADDVTALIALINTSDVAADINLDESLDSFDIAKYFLFLKTSD